MTATGTAASLPLWHEAFAGLDWLSLRLSPVYRGEGIPRGDGAPVLLVPGFMASDTTMFELHRWLGRLGHMPHFAAVGRMSRCPDELVSMLEPRLDRIARGRPVSVIGHSLGGLLARGLAMRRPDLVQRVITLGTPVVGDAVHPAVQALARVICADCGPECVETLQGPLPARVPETNIYSPADGIVARSSCTTDGARHIMVDGTHCGLIVNARAYAAIGAALASPPAAQAAVTVAPDIARTTVPEWIYRARDRRAA